MKDRIDELKGSFDAFYDATDAFVHYKDKSITNSVIVFKDKKTGNAIEIDSKDDLEIEIIGKSNYPKSL